MKRVIGPLLALALLLATAVVVFWPRPDAWMGGPVRDAAPPGPGGRGGGAEPERSPEPERSTPPAQAPMAAYYSQRLDWQPCRDGLECSTLRVPQDYGEPRGRSLGLALLRVPASGERIGSLVVNPGGPGVPGTDYAAYGAQVFGEALLESFDIVGFDPRGTGSSSPVDCLSDGELDDYLAADPTPDTAAEASALVNWARRFGQGCVSRSGAVASHVTTIEAARDMNVLRAVLGEERLSFFGASYGTQLGATYADLFPDRVGRMVLDGAVDVSLGLRATRLQQAAGFETALRAYVQDCVRENALFCFLGDSVQEGTERIARLLEEIDARPLPTDQTARRLEVGTAFYGLVAPLYQRAAWPALSAGLEAAFDGDGTLLLGFSDLYTARRPTGGYRDNRMEALTAISCLDDPSFVAPSRVDDLLPQFQRVSPTFGEAFAHSLIACGGTVARSTEPKRDIRAEGAPPILVLGTTRDPATPMRWAVALAERLESGVLVRRDGDGHTAYHAGNACVDGAVESYLVDGEVPEDGLSC